MEKTTTRKPRVPMSEQIRLINECRLSIPIEISTLFGKW